MLTVAEYAKGLTYAQYSTLKAAVDAARRTPPPTHPTTYGLGNTSVRVLERLGLVEFAPPSYPGNYYRALIPTEAGLALFPVATRSDADRG